MIDTQQKRMSAAGAGRPYLRAVFPVAAKDVEWRMSVGLIYAGTALVTSAQVALVQLVGVFHRLQNLVGVHKQKEPLEGQHG